MADDAGQLELKTHDAPIRVGDRIEFNTSLIDKKRTMSLTSNPLKWRSSNPQVLEIRSEGQHGELSGHAVAMGEARVIINDGSQETSTLFRVVAKPMSIRFAPPLLNLQLDDSINLDQLLMVSYSDGFQHLFKRWLFDKKRIYLIDDRKIVNTHYPGFFIKALSLGKASIQAKVYGLTATLDIHVSENSPTAIHIKPLMGPLYIGDQLTLSTLIYYQNGTAPDAGPPLLWHSSNVDIIKVDQKGKITAITAGEAKITVQIGQSELRAVQQVQVNEYSLKRLWAEKQVINMVRDAEYPLPHVWAEYQDGHQQNVGARVPYNIDRPDIIDIHDGKVQSKRMGDAVIQFQYQGKELNIVVHVGKDISAERLNCNFPANMHLLVGETWKTSCSLRYPDPLLVQPLDGIILTVNSNNPSIMIVEPNLTGSSVGNATIQVQAGRFTQSVNVTVTQLSSTERRLETPNQLHPGQAVDWQLIETFSDGYQRKLSGGMWAYSSNQQIMKVNDNQVVAKNVGHATLHVEFGGKQYQKMIVVDGERVRNE